MNKIFVSIAAYEDDLLVNTVKELYENAMEPQNIFIYIALQYKDMPNFDKIANKNQIKIKTYSVKNRPGVARIRYEITHDMLNDKKFNHQDYFLMIDAHMNFAKNWDADLIRDFKHLQKVCGKKEIIISKQSSKRIGMLGDEHYEDSIMHLKKHHVPLISRPITLFSTVPEYKYNVNNIIDRNIICGEEVEHKFIHSGWASCHFFFTDFDFIQDVGLDNNSQIFQEEPYLSFRSFLSGYDIYSNITYNYLGHNSVNQHNGLYDPRYWMLEQDGTYIKIFGETSDSEFSLLCLLAYAKNLGPYAIKNAIRTPEMFFQYFNILDVYNNLVNDLSLIDFLVYLNKEYEKRGIFNM